MKTTKALQKLIGLAAVGTALMLTGSAARAADGSGNQAPNKEICPRQCDEDDGCAYCEQMYVEIYGMCNFKPNKHLESKYFYLSKVKISGSRPDCLDCNGDCKSNEVTHYFEIYKCIHSSIEYDCDGNVFRTNPSVTEQCQVKWAIPTGNPCP